MKKLLLIQITILMSAFSFAKIEVLDRVAIIVDEGVVMESQIKDLVQTTKLRSIEQGMQLPPTEALLEEIQEQLIIQELQLQRGEEFGIRISDGELNQTFIQIAANNGVSLEQFIRDYEASGQNYEKLREEIRRDMIIQRVQRGIVGGSINITAQEIEGFLATEEAIAQLTPELLVRQIQVGSLEAAETILSRLEEGENFEALVEEKSINQNKSQGGLMPWRKINEMPSVFADAIRNQSLGFISEPIKTGSGFHLLKLEEKRGPLVKFEEQWETRHVLLIPSAIRDVDATKAEAEVLRERILAGEDFALIAEEFSEDPGSGSNGGNLEWLPKGATVGEFENVMLNSEINEVSEVFESQFGFHFLEVTGKRVEDVTDYQIEERAYSVLFSRKYDEELENTLRSMRAEAFVEFKDLD
ncbi:MAG: chaperone SurA [Gammaproteobacteria bacterium]|jgi:peptidyl-prolyl cis-trans isomerase SurA|nr:MAG: chaperone SurA [Gammaproteobacteria bacterium]